jgi:hypothetical protein
MADIMHMEMEKLPYRCKEGFIHNDSELWTATKSKAAIRGNILPPSSEWE